MSKINYLEDLVSKELEKDWGIMGIVSVEEAISIVEKQGQGLKTEELKPLVDKVGSKFIQCMQIYPDPKFAHNQVKFLENKTRFTKYFNLAMKEYLQRVIQSVENEKPILSYQYCLMGYYPEYIPEDLMEGVVKRLPEAYCKEGCYLKQSGLIKREAQVGFENYKNLLSTLAKNYIEETAINCIEIGQNSEHFELIYPVSHMIKDKLLSKKTRGKAKEIYSQYKKERASWHKKPKGSH